MCTNGSVLTTLLAFLLAEFFLLIFYSNLRSHSSKIRSQISKKVKCSIRFVLMLKYQNFVLSKHDFVYDGQGKSHVTMIMAPTSQSVKCKRFIYPGRGSYSLQIHVTPFMKEADDLGKKQVLEDRRRCSAAHLCTASEHRYGSSHTH